MAMEAAFAVLVCFEAAGRKRILARTVSFVLTTYFAGGMIMALLVIWEQEGIYTAAGIYTGDMKAPRRLCFLRGRHNDEADNKDCIKDKNSDMSTYWMLRYTGRGAQ